MIDPNIVNPCCEWYIKRMEDHIKALEEKNRRLESLYKREQYLRMKIIREKGGK